MRKALVCMTAVVVTSVMIRERMCVSEKPSDDLVIQNIEALAEGESVSSQCFGEGNLLCPNGKKVRFYRAGP